MKRFEGPLSTDYDLSLIAFPSYEDSQKEIGRQLSIYLANMKDLYPSGVPIIIYEGGCGTGITTQILLEADDRIQVVAIDDEPEMIKQAQQKLQPYGDRVTYAEKDIFDALDDITEVPIFISGFTIHNLDPEKRAELFKKLAKKLMKNGLFLNADKIARDNEALHQQDLQAQLTALHAYTEKGHPQLEQLWIDHYIEDDAIKLTEKEQIDALKACGFTKVELVYRNLMDAIIVAIK